MPVISRIAANAARAFGMFAVSVAKDLYFKYVTLLLPGNGTNGAQNNTFLDSSTNNFTITRNGNTTQGTFAPYGVNWSNYFGSGNYINAASNAAFSPGTGDFTVEAWVYPNAAYTTYNYILGVAVTNGLVFYVTGGNLVVRAFNTGDLLSSATIPALNTWTHVAATRSGTTLRIFVNGVQTATTTNSTNFAQGAAYVGNDSTNAAPWYGYISNFRFVKGTAVYTSDFTPSTVPLTAISGTSLLTCQSNRFIDNSSNAFAITVTGSPSVQRFSPFSPTAAYSASTIGGSGYFDGSGDYLSVSAQTALGMGAGDFTYEAWVYVNEIVPTNALRGLFDSRVSGATGCGIYTSADTGTTSKLVYATNSAIAASSTNTIKPYTWTHVAVTRSGTTVRGFLNGVLEFTYTDSRTFSSSAGTYIGADVSPAYFNGYINDARILKGTAQYTAAFTPPTAPLTAISGTSLLLSCTNAGVIDNAMMNDLETVGNAQISTTQSKWGGSSIAFDGTDDRLTNNNYVNQNLVMGTGDFTIEGWFYTASPATNRGLFQISTTAGGLEAGNTNNIAVYCSSSVLGVYYNDTFKAGTTSISSSTWTHFALVRNSGTTKLYVNGTADSGFGSNADTRNYTGGYIVVGGYFSTSFLWNGYIDDLRITKGIARYTSNFTAPTAAFPLQ